MMKHRASNAMNVLNGVDEGEAGSKSKKKGNIQKGGTVHKVMQ